MQNSNNKKELTKNKPQVNEAVFLGGSWIFHIKKKKKSNPLTFQDVHGSDSFRRQFQEGFFLYLGCAVNQMLNLILKLCNSQ